MASLLATAALLGAVWLGMRRVSGAMSAIDWRGEPPVVSRASKDPIYAPPAVESPMGLAATYSDPATAPKR